MRSHDALPLNFVSDNRKNAQLPNVPPQQQPQHQQAPRQHAYTFDGSDLVQHVNYGQHNQPDNTNSVTAVHVSSNGYITPSKAGSNNESFNSNSLSDHSYDLHQESEMLTTSYGPSWQSSATQSLVVADSAASSLCSTTLPSSLNEAHRFHSPTKSINTPLGGNSPGSKMIGPQVNVDLTLADSVITENTEVLERALFGSRGDGEGSSLTNSLLNVTGTTIGHQYLQQINQSQNYSDYSRSSHNTDQPHPQLVLHHTNNGSHGNQQNDHMLSHHSNTSSPSYKAANENSSVSYTVMSRPDDYNNYITTTTTATAISVTGEISPKSNQVTGNNAVTNSHSPVAEQFQSHYNQRSPQNGATLSLSNSGKNATQLQSDAVTGNSPPMNRQAIQTANSMATSSGPSNNLPKSNSEQNHVLLSDNRTAITPSSDNPQTGTVVNNRAVDDGIHNNSDVTMPAQYQSDTCGNTNRRQLLQQSSVSSDVMATRSSVEGDGCSQSRADNTANANNQVVTSSHDPSEHHVTITDGGQQLEHTVLSFTPQSTNNDGQFVERSNAIRSSSQNQSSPISTSHQLSSTLEDSTVESDNVIKQCSPLSQREAGVGTSMLFSTSPLPAITSTHEKVSSTAEASGKPAELDEGMYCVCVLCVCVCVRVCVYVCVCVLYNAV